MKKQTDPNIQAYLLDVKNGKFTDFAPGTWVAYKDGEFVLSGRNKNSFFTRLRKIKSGCFVTQVNIPVETVDLGGSIVYVRSPKIKKPES